MSGLHILLGDKTGELVRRKIVVFKRLEPGDSPSLGSHPLKESPYLEGRVVEIAIGKELHERMVALEKRRTGTVRDTVSLGAKYDIPGMLIAGAGGGMVGAFFDFLPLHIVPYLAGIFGLGVVLGFVTRVRKRGGEIAAEERWKAMPEQKEYDALARDLSDAWISFANELKKDPGYHVELRVAEGSDDPLRLASIDPRGFIAMPPTFDPEDFLPTEGAGVRYEVVHAQGEVVTRLLEGVKDSPLPEKASAAKEPSAEASDPGPSTDTAEAEAEAEDEPPTPPPEAASAPPSASSEPEEQNAP